MVTEFLERPGKPRLAYKSFDPAGEGGLLPAVRSLIDFLAEAYAELERADAPLAR